LIGLDCACSDTERAQPLVLPFALVGAFTSQSSCATPESSRHQYFYHLHLFIQFRSSTERPIVLDTHFSAHQILFQPISSKGSHSDRHQPFSNSPLSPLLLLGEVWLIKSVSVSCLRFKLPTNHHGSQHARPDSTTRRDQLSRTRFVCPCVISTRDLTLLEPRISQVSYTSSNCKMRR
jgi:hypothetical protein